MQSRNYNQMKTGLAIWTIVAVLGTNSAVHAGGGGIPGGYATEFTQYLNYLRLLDSTLKQAQMIANQVQSIKLQVESLKSIQRLDASEWGKAMMILRQLDYIVRQGRAISYALQNVEQEFKKTFPGYLPAEDYIRSYQEWSQTTLDSIQGTLMAAGFQSQQFETENATLETIRSFSENAVGQTQAIQAANMIANETVSQLQKLRQLHMSQIQAQSVYMALEVQRESADQAAMEKFFQKVPYEKSTSRGY
jgi:P-type conjugative transfer protein TrbJ